MFSFEFQYFPVVLDNKLFISFTGLLPVGFKFLPDFFQILSGLAGDRKTSFIQEEEDDQQGPK